MRKPVILFTILVLLVAGAAAVLRLSGAPAQARQGEVETQPVRRGNLQVTVDADGVVRAAQSAALVWQTTGTVQAVNVQAGETVSAGQVLATLEQTSLPRPLILAQADLIEAQRALDHLFQSQVEQSQAQQALEQAEQALEDARQPGLAQAKAQAALAQAQKAFENAQRDLEIAQSPASPQAIEAAHGTLLLWANALERVRQDIERVQRKLKKDASAYLPGESHDFYENLLTNLTLKLVNYQRSYEDASQRYQDMMRPPAPGDLAVAQANLDLAKGQLDQAKLEVERLKDGTSPTDLAVLQAQLEDARRGAERLKDGPDPSEVAAAQARLAAVQASLELSRQAAPFHGVITEVDVKPGDQVTPGSPAFRLDDLSSMRVEMQTSEVDINRIQTGQSVILKLDAAPGREYHGKVVEVPAVGNDVNGIATFTLKVAIEDADSSIRPAMTAKATIIVTELKDVMLVPANAVRILDGQHVVYILRNGKPELVQVALGPSSANETQVLEGNLQAGDAVVLNPGGG